MMFQIEKWRRSTVPLALGIMCCSYGQLFAAEPAKTSQPTDAKICLNCHKPQAENLRGHFDGLSMKTQAIQVEIDGNINVVQFDKNSLKVLNAPEQGDLEKQLRSVKKGHQIRVEYKEKDGGKLMTLLAVKPPLKIPAEKLMKLDDMEKIVALGPEKGKFYLFDSRPPLRFDDGSIPYAVNLPFSALKKMADKLPKDKDATIILFCQGVTCALSPNSATELAAMGYTNVKIYHDGVPDWIKRNYLVISTKSFKEAWIDKDASHVLIDIRSNADIAKGFIKGAVSITPDKLDEVIKSFPDKKLKAPIIVYDETGGDQAAAFAKKLVSKGYNNAKLLTGGYSAWVKANYPVEKGTPSTKVVYVPKPKPGEIDMELFKKYLTAIPADTLLVDARPPSEFKEGTIKGAINVPAGEIDQYLDKLPKDKKIVSFCNTGTLAEMEYHTLKAKGYANIFFLNANVEFDEGKIEVSK